MTSFTETKKLTVSDKCCVAVCGGGFAGVAAALAAARNCIDVLLIEREYMVGGLGTSGLISIYLPICDGNGHQVCYGIAEELLYLAASDLCCEGMFPKFWMQPNASAEQRKKSERFMVQYNPFMYALELERKLIESGVRLLYGTGIHDVIMDGPYIQGIVIENKSGRSIIEVDCVIDCTGDADICTYAKAPVRSYAPKNPLACWYNYFENGRIILDQFGAADQTDEDPSHEYKHIGNMRASGIDAKENSAYIVMGHEKIREEILRNRNSGRDVRLTSMCTVPNFRMTRCLCGESMCRMPHDGEKIVDSVGLFSDWTRRGPVYQLPFSALYSKSVRNLLTAGRCISSSDDMWNITRAIPVCVVSGEAAGTAFSLSPDTQKISFQDLQEKLHSQNILTNIDPSVFST